MHDDDGKTGYIRMVCFFFDETATTEIYTLSLHDALPISQREMDSIKRRGAAATRNGLLKKRGLLQRESGQKSGALPQREMGRIKSGVAAARSEEHTSELQSRETISYAVFCLKKKKTSHMRYNAHK